MDLTSPQIIKELLKKHGSFASKRLGQHFLIDKAALSKIIAAADLGKDDVVLEIGPGIGALTQELAKRVKKVIAVEKDPKMCEILKEILADHKNINIIPDDVLKLNPNKLPATSYKLVANLPYYITSPIIRLFLEKIEAKPQYMVLMVQKEVAQRICAKPPNMSLLAISVQFYAESKIVAYVSKSCFWPQPKVDSAIIRLWAKPGYAHSLAEKTLFFNILHAGFSQPRKQLINNLSTGLKLDRTTIEKWLFTNNINPKQRAETLSLENWLKLTESYKAIDFSSPN